MSEKERLEKERTTLWVSKKTRNDINELKSIPEEHADSVIQKLIKEHKETKKDE